MKGLYCFWAILIMVVILMGCGYKQDRCWVDDSQYLKAKKIYQTTRNLDLVRRHLEDQRTWRPCEINEAIYRIKKEYHLEEEVK